MEKYRICFINMEAVNEFADYDTEKYTTRKQWEDKCLEIEANKHGLFFRVDEEHNCFYTEDKEPQIIALFNEAGITNYEDLFYDYGQYLYDNCNKHDEVELGRFIRISHEAIYAHITDCLLDDEEIINELINAEDFEFEINKLKKEAIEMYIDIAINEAKWDLKEGKIDLSDI